MSLWMLLWTTLSLVQSVVGVRPLVIWHGLGDSYASPGMLEFISMLQDIHPGMYVHSVRIDEDIKQDQKATWFGDVLQQVELVAHQLASIPDLSDGFDAIGFSQGGQFLRAYTEFYNTPPVHNLITFGSQHMGISDLPGCKLGDFLCQLARNAAKGGVYTDWAQRNLIQAQYYRDTLHLPTYLVSNHFLTSLNNEVPPSAQNKSYATNLASLENLVLVLFTEDTTVVPKETSWFGSYEVEEQSRWGLGMGWWWWPANWMTFVFGSVWDTFTTQKDERVIVPMREQPLYIKDTIGLRKLDKAGRLHLESCEAPHMQISRSCWEPLVRTYLGGA